MKSPISAARANLRDEHTRPLATEALRLEHRISDLVNAAYHLTPDEIALLWQTAPPRMPIGGPGHWHSVSVPECRFRETREKKTRK